MPQAFYEIASTAAENIQIPRMGIVLEILLDLQRQGVHAAPHVGRPGRQPDTVDHIMPQGERLPEAWKAELGPDWAQVWHTWRHTLGNLTCTAFNSEMGNRSFREKRDAEQGFRNSPLLLNADLRETERWDGDAIRDCGARLADLAVEIWRRPVLTDRVLASYKTPRADAGGYTIEHHPHLRPGAPMHDLFEAVRQAILALGPQVREEFLKHYVAYKTQTNFVDVVPQKRPPPADAQHAFR